MKMEFDISKMVEEIAMQAEENQEEFIFQTIHPYCENILQIKINKEELKQILLNSIRKQQPCEDCISRQAVIQKINNKLNPCTDMFKCLEMSEIKEDVENLPSVKPTRPKGVWLKREYWSNGVGMGETYGYYYQCSECKNKVKGGNESCNAKFCSNCGAQMGGSK